jgi:hypothetical protein
MLGTRISRKALATAQVNTVDLWHDIIILLLFDW